MAGHADEAIHELRRALTLVPSAGSYAIHDDLARAQFLAKDVAACLAEAEEMEKLKPGSADACGWRARVFHARGEDEKARAEIVRGLRRDPSNAGLTQLARELGLRTE
jgi:hypothetical protein